MSKWMMRAVAVFGGLMAAMVATCPAVVMAQDLVSAEDVLVLYQPEPARYQPDGDDIDLQDQGKSFEVTCVITKNGRMTDCQAEDNDLVDQNFVDIAVKNVSRWVVGPQTRAGDSTDGRILVVTCRFQLEGQRDDRRYAAR